MEFRAEPAVEAATHHPLATQLKVLAHDIRLPTAVAGRSRDHHRPQQSNRIELALALLKSRRLDGRFQRLLRQDDFEHFTQIGSVHGVGSFGRWCRHEITKPLRRLFSFLDRPIEKTDRPRPEFNILFRCANRLIHIGSLA